MGNIKIGNSGWSYKDWVGTFYPNGTSSDRMLNIYLQHFSTVEINSTFYRVPSPSAISRWAEIAAKKEEAEFCVKVPQTISHISSMERMSERMTRDYAKFSNSVLEPLDDRGVLGAVLFQASPYFTVRGDIKYQMKSEPKVPLPEYILGVERLKEICTMMKDHPGERAIELRNSSWINERSDLIDEAKKVLRFESTALVTVDGPSFPWINVDTSRHNYIRFHGRNREGWFKDTGEDSPGRYEYLYKEEELREKVDPIKILASKVDKDTRIFFNNHPQGNAPRNAESMMKMFGIERPVVSMEHFLSR